MKQMERDSELEAMLVKFYNIQAGTSLRSSNPANQNLAYELIQSQGGIVDAKKYVKEFVLNNPQKCKEANGFAECCKYAPRKQSESDVPSEDQVSTSLGILEKTLVKIVAETSAEKIENEIMGNVKNAVRDFIKSEYGVIERKVVTVVDGVPKKMDGVQHEKFDTVLKFVANNEPVFLTGPAGSGKNVLCKQIADALGLKFYFTNAVTQEYKLTGFTDAMGNYQPTQFYKAFTEGGVFMLDEMDASIPEVLVILNAAIANRYFDFPAPIGYVEAHPDFRVIAAGNTIGHGADFEYVGRNQLDGASLDRFAIVRIEYSKTIEDSVAGDVELADFCRDFRRAAEKAGVQIIVSYRSIGRLAKMTKLLSIEEALETCLIKGMEKDDVHMIAEGMRTHNVFKTALEKLAA